MEDRESWLDDTLIEILDHLPIKSLLRVKCISKYWGNLIKSPNFVKIHLRHDCKETLLVKHYLPPNNCKEIYQQGGDDVLSFHDPDHSGKIDSSCILVPFVHDVYGHVQTDLFGPCNGLVCFVSDGGVVLSNPALRELKLVDQSPYACPEGYKAFNWVSGFGYNANTSDYKIIQMWEITEIIENYYNLQDVHIEINLYNSSTNAWRIIDAMVPGVQYDPGFDLLFNGACHWRASKYRERMITLGILSFDLTNDVFRKFEFPNTFDFGTSHGLVVLNQCLALVCYEMDELHLVDIWLMKEYGNKESWTKEYVIGPYLFNRPLSCWGNGWLCVETSDSELAACAIHENKIKRFQLHGFGKSFRAVNYRESLITLSKVLL